MKHFPARFEAKVRRTETCWLWTGAVGHGSGYGKVCWQTLHIKAHRLAFYFAMGRWPTRALHACGNNLCVRVNKSHVYEGTQKQNAADMMRHGTHWCFRVISPDKAREIQKRYRRGDVGRRIAADLGVSPMAVSRIGRGLTRKRTT